MLFGMAHFEIIHKSLPGLSQIRNWKYILPTGLVMLTIMMDTFQQDLKRFQEGWKCFWVIFETQNSQVQKLGMLPTRLETNPIGLEMLHIHRRFGSITICPTALEYVQLCWKTIQDEFVQLRWNLSNYIGSCPTLLEHFRILQSPHPKKNFSTYRTAR